MTENPLLSDDELMELYCSKTGLPETSYHDMIKTWEQINEIMNEFGDLLQRLYASKQSRHKQRLAHEYQTLCNTMQTFEIKYKIKCTDSVPDAIRTYQPPPPEVSKG